MTTAMANLPDIGRSDWQPGHIPRLSYRNPLPSGEQVLQRDAKAQTPSARKTTGQSLSIREIREALPREHAALPYRAPTAPSPVQPQKPKKSFLGGLFAKEPSMAALDQVAQQMLAQHGSISPKAIPNVSSQKMPDHVPRVNSKWDGVPDHVKMREKQEKGKAKTGHRSSLRPVQSRSISADFPDDQSVIRRRNSNAASTADSWDSRSSGSHPTFQDSISTHPESVYSTSSGDSSRSTNRLNSATPHAYSAFSSSKSADLPLYCLDETPTPPKRPHVLQSLPSTSTNSSSSSEPSQSDYSPKIGIPSSEAIPEYTSSSATTPLERSPKTPTPFLDDENGLDALLNGEVVLPASMSPKTPPGHPQMSGSNETKSKSTTKKNMKTGLGVRNTSIVAPWETQELPSEVLRSPQVESPLKLRGKGRLFGREKK